MTAYTGCGILIVLPLSAHPERAIKSQPLQQVTAAKARLSHVPAHTASQGNHGNSAAGLCTAEVALGQEREFPTHIRSNARTPRTAPTQEMEPSRSGTSRGFLSVRQ